MTPAEETALLERFAKAAGAGEMLNIHDLKAAYETAIGHETYHPRSMPALTAARQAMIAGSTAAPFFISAPGGAAKAAENCRACPPGNSAAVSNMPFLPASNGGSSHSVYKESAMLTTNAES